MQEVARGAQPAVERIQSEKWQAPGTNQIRVENVQRRMFSRLLILGRKWPGRVRKPTIRSGPGLEMLSGDRRSRTASGSILTLLFLFTLAHRSGEFPRLPDWPMFSGLDRAWSSTEQLVKGLQKRVRTDYQAVWLSYCLTHRLLNAEEPADHHSRPAKRSWEQCRLMEPMTVIPSRAANQRRDCAR